MELLKRCWRSVIDYFRARTWLVIWLAIFAASLILLAATGQFHTQGNGYPTIYEWSAIAIHVGVWLIAKLALKHDLTEEYLLGLIFGIQWEFLTEPYWTYLPHKVNVLVWRDIPILMLMAWGLAFALALLLSHWIGKKLFGLDAKSLVFDWRILLCDAIAISVVGGAAEWTYGVLLGCWKYEVDFGLGKSPLGLGWEIHIGYMIVMFWYGTTFRVWKMKLEGALPVGSEQANRE
jgi:hypothetical protein